MKLEEYIECIFGCLERIENKINGLSVPLPEGNSPTVNNTQDESVLNEVRNGHETFRKLLARVYEGLAAIKNDMVSMDRKNSSQERLGQVLSEMRNVQRQHQEKVEASFQPECRIPVHSREFFRDVRDNRDSVRGSLFFGENR